MIDAVFAWRQPHLLGKGAVEGSHRIEADALADFGDRVVCLSQQLAGIGYAQGIDIVVKAHVQLGAHHVRNVIFADVQLALETIQREYLRRVGDAVIEDHTQHVIVAGLCVHQGHSTQQMAEKAQQIAVQNLLLIGGILIKGFRNAVSQQGKMRVVGCPRQQIGGGNFGKRMTELGQNIGTEFQKHVFLTLQGFEAVNLIGKDDDDVSRAYFVDVVVYPYSRFSARDEGKLDLMMKMGNVPKGFSLVARIAAVKILASLFVDNLHRPISFP